MNPFFSNTDASKGVSSKDNNAEENQATSKGLNPAAPAFTPKSGKGNVTDTNKTPSGLGPSQKDTELEEEFPGLTETHPIPVWVSNESGQELSNSQLRRRRRWRKAAREAEQRKAEKEKANLQQEYTKINDNDEAEGPSRGNRYSQYKKKGEGFLNNV
jgi:hypothetical protein